MGFRGLESSMELQLRAGVADFPVRKAIGSKGGYLFLNIDDPNDVVMFLEVDDLEKARQFVQSEELRQAMERNGVADQPDIYFLDLVDKPSA